MDGETDLTAASHLVSSTILPFVQLGRVALNLLFTYLTTVHSLTVVESRAVAFI